MRAAGRLPDDWPVRDGDPFASPDRLPAGTDLGSVSRFGDSRWNLSPLSSHSHATAVTVNWQLVEDPVLRESVRRAGWALVNLPVPEEMLQRSATRRARWPSAATIAGHLTQLRRFANWLTHAGISSLAEVTTADLERYAAHLEQRGSVRAATDGLYALIRLWGVAPHLPSHDRIPMPPWEATDLSDYLPDAVRANENTTAPIHPAVMSPLLIWSLRFADDFADDIISAWHEYRRLIAQIPQADAPDGRQKILSFLRRHISQGRPLPGRPHGGGVHRADSYIAAMLQVSPRQVKNTLNRHPEAKDAGLSPHAPLDTVVTGRLHGQPWKPFIDFHEAPALMRLLSAACMITTGYLSGMRPGEVLSLKSGCCPEPDADGTAPPRYAIYGNVLKGVRDEQGRCIPDGKPRDLPWTVIPPTVHAIRVLERIAEGDDLFPVVTAWNNQTAHNAARKRTGHLLTAAGARDRIRGFIGYANQLAAQHDLDWERIPDDPDGPVALSRMRRTIAWHIARLPGGRIALALQYGHLRASTVTEGYSGRARHGLRRVLDIETARAMADYLDDLAGRVSHGEGVSGPAARRMITAAQASAARFQGMFLTPKMADAWLDDPRLTVYDNPDAFLTCNHDPAKALCRPGQARRQPPAIERCDPACANIARTPTSAGSVRRSPSLRQRSPTLLPPPRSVNGLNSGSPSSMASPTGTTEPALPVPSLRNPPHMSDDDEREAITAAMQRLLAGRPLRSSGDLTIVALAEEAGLRRNKLTHKHTDLKDLFYAEVKARKGIPASEIKLRGQVTALEARIESLRQERDDYRAATETFARAINALTVENDILRKELGKRRSSAVTALPKRP